MVPDIQRGFRDGAASADPALTARLKSMQSQPVVTGVPVDSGHLKQKSKQKKQKQNKSNLKQQILKQSLDCFK